MHPRQSILSMFDPLNQPSQREQDQNSEKENATPTRSLKSGDSLTMTAFFNRTYKANSQYVQPTFKRRLVDVGDVTVDEVSIISLGLEGLQEESEEIDFGLDDEADTTVVMLHGPLQSSLNDDVEPATPKVPAYRTPLVEIAFENDQSPIPRARTSSNSSQETPTNVCAPIVALQISPEDCSSPFKSPSTNALAPRLDTRANNLVSDEGTAPGTDTDDIPPLTTLPAITVSSPNNPSLPLPSIDVLDTTSTPVTNDDALAHAKSDDHPAVASSSQLTPRLALRRAPMIDPDDPRRCSVDLQQSFCLQMQCPDSSFDLLNDKISFFASAGGLGMNTFLEEEDESFDLEFSTGVKSKGLSAVPKNSNEAKQASAELSLGTPPKDVSPLKDTSDVPNLSPTVTVKPPSPLPATQFPTKDSPLSTDSTNGFESNPSTGPKLPECFPVYPKAAIDVGPSATPKSAITLVPPPVHALRIVKRSKLQKLDHSRPRPSVKPRVEPNPPQPSMEPQLASVPSVAEVSKPSSISTTTSSRPARLGFIPPRPPIPKLGQAANSTSPTFNQVQRPGAPGRVPISEEGRSAAGGIGRVTRAVTSPPVSASTTAFPARRVPLVSSNTKSFPAVSNLNDSTGVPKPSRIPSVSTSGLPRIASAPSRLPAPSAGIGSRGRAAGGVTGTAVRSIRTVPGKRVN